MKTTKQKNLIMTSAAAVILVAVNVGILMAANKGTIAPISNMGLWGAFVVLNVASILWTISLLGLQPFVVSLSYVAGGFLAYQGVRGMGDISVAEVTTAGATYGAFGALAIGNVTAKVRLAFFQKGQVPFVFVIVGLLVIDAVLNSGISSAGGSVILNAVVFPFILAGIIVGLIWSVLNRYGIGRKPAEVLAAVAEETAAEQAELESAIATEKLVIQMPEHAMMAEEPEDVVEVTEPIAPAAVVAEPVRMEEKKQEEEFFPLEIDKGEESTPPAVQPVMRAEEVVAPREEFSMPMFDANLYESGSPVESAEGGVLVQEPAVAVALDLDAEIVAPPVAEVNAAPVPKAEPKSKDEDWLGSHLELLNKLK